MARRDIEPGETILIDKPLAVGPNPGGTLQCITCGFGVFRFINKLIYFYFITIEFCYRLAFNLNYIVGLDIIQLLEMWVHILLLRVLID